MSQALTFAEPEARQRRRLNASILYTIPEVADVIGRSERTVRKLLAEGKGPRVTVIGRSRMVRDVHLNEWLEAQAA